MIVIGITGTLGAGKGTIVEYLKTRGFGHFSARDFIVEEVERRGLAVNRDTINMTANSLRQAHGPAYIIESLYKKAAATGNNTVIESLRVIGEVEAMRALGKDFVLFAIDADPKIRYERITLRASVTDNVSFEKFLSDESRESNGTEKWDMNLPACQALADYRLFNNGTIHELNKQVDEVLQKIAL